MKRNNSKKLEDFLLAEYNNSAEAHFKSTESISTFFRYYLLIMSLPLSATGIIFQFGSDKVQVISLLNQYKLPIFIILFSISLIGLGIFCYIVNLRLNVVLYVRVVNGIRKFFYDKSDEDINLKLRWRVLPQNPQLPFYFEKSVFFPVVFVFAIMNGVYFFLGLYVITINSNFLMYIVIALILFILLHFIIYKLYSQYRELAYLDSAPILGIDIDGVLTEHQKHFCETLKNKTKKEITVEKILIIPLHEYSLLNITREDERKVFNDPEYWKKMPLIENAEQIIKIIKRDLKLKIYVFTYRPWPDLENDQELIEKTKLFCKNSNGFTLQILFLKIGMIFRFKWLIKKLKEEPLKLITKQWLKEKGILYDKFILEKGNDYSSSPKNRFKNRFYISRKKKIKFFVEDDYEKALKLAYICDVVFLFSHPYNEPNDALPDTINKLRENLPSNVIRVKNWNEIYQHIRRLL